MSNALMLPLTYGLMDVSNSQNPDLNHMGIYDAAWDYI